jgi:DNA-directed RNA polymerase subunit RPC12/RpoP/Zn-finger nucleic acid-binding protein
MINCPSCRSKMDSLALESHLCNAVAIDACWPCHLIWFDHLESSSLSAASVIELFKRIHEAQSVPTAAARNTVSNNMSCPSCSTGLKLTNDIQKNGRFSYHRCHQGHGRATSFTQFLREKNFIRSLNPIEIKKLSVSIKQIRCSSCGASVDLTHDTSCTHCGSAIAVLDHDAVEKALTALQAQQAKQLGATAEQRARLEVALERIRETPTYSGHRQSAPDGSLDWLIAGGVLITAAGSGSDLVDVGIGALAALFD